jgi:hypothetical protein
MLLLLLLPYILFIMTILCNLSLSSNLKINVCIHIEKKNNRVNTTLVYACMSCSLAHFIKFIYFFNEIFFFLQIVSIHTKKLSHNNNNKNNHRNNGNLFYLFFHSPFSFTLAHSIVQCEEPKIYFISCPALVQQFISFSLSCFCLWISVWVGLCACVPERL